MSRKPRYPRSSSSSLDGPAYISWSNNAASKTKAVAEYSNAVGEFKLVNQKAKGYWNQDLSDLDTNISGRPGLSKSDYYAFRPEEAPPTSYKSIIHAAEQAYQNVGLIRNIIDLMADFACQGIRIVHPNKRIEKFYQNWFARVNGKERSERFLNNLYRTGNVVIRKQTAKIKLKAEKEIYKTVATPDIEIKELVINKKEIPWKYTFLNPQFVEVVGGSLSCFVGYPTYAIKVPQNLARQIKAPKTALEKALIKQIPQEIIDAATKNGAVLLNPDKTVVCHYKKDDWQTWAYPMIYAIMDDIQLLDKLKLADMTALDGAISNIRIFKIGNFEHQIAPTAVAAARLGEVLEANVGGGTINLIWGPDIELVESKTEVHKFLGEEKYKPHLNSIYAGLGIPPTLTGTVGNSGTTNNLISLKTLMGRLAYGREVLQGFWMKELVEVQKAMGFRFPAKIEFSLQNLGDEAAEKALLIQLADRDLISHELLQTLFGNDPDMERIRINREFRDRGDGKMTPKSSPYHDPQFGLALKKLALQSGILTPSQVGLREDTNINDLKLYPNIKGEKPALEMKQTPVTDTKKGQPYQGRPKNAKDKKKRKSPTFSPKVRASIEIWANYAQDVIANILHNDLLKKFNKTNMRKLSAAEANQAEIVKFGVLCNLSPFVNIDDNVVYDALHKNIPENVYNIYRSWSAQISNDLNRPLALDELKHIQSCIYTSYVGDNNG